MASENLPYAVGGGSFLAFVGGYALKLIRRSDTIVNERIKELEAREAVALAESMKWRQLYFRAIGLPIDNLPSDGDQQSVLDHTELEP